MKKELHLGVLFTGKLDDSFRKAINTIKGELDGLATAMGKVNKVQEEQATGLVKVKQHMNDYINNIKKLLIWQAQWYGAKAVLFAGLGVPTAVIASTVQYTAEIDKIRANLLRWEATSGKVTKEMIAQNDAMVMAVRKASLQYPLSIKEIAEAAEAFLGANVAPKIVTDMIPMIAQLKTAFPEINFEKWAIAVTGAFNVFRDQLSAAGGEVIGFQKLFEKLMVAQKEGIIRPEQFADVMQYMAQMSKLVGFNVDEMLALSVAVTNTGQKASSAARLLQGLFQSLQTEKATKKMDAFAGVLGSVGIKFDKSKTLASQFYAIIGQLEKLFNSDGTLNAGAAQFLNTLTSSDRSRILMTLIPNLQTVHDLLGKLNKSSGSLQTVADLMSQPIGAQWEIFLNTLREITVTANGKVIPALQKLVAGILDVARGVLFGLAPAGQYTDLLKLMGPAGQEAYRVTKDLKDVFLAAWSAIEPLLKALGIFIGLLLKLTQWLSKNTYLIEVLSAYIGAKLVLALIAATAKLIAFGKGLQFITMIQAAKSFADLASAVGFAGGAIANIGRIVLAFATGPLGLLIAGLTAAILLFKAARYERDKWDNRKADFKTNLAAITTSEQARVEIENRRKRLSEITDDNGKTLKSGAVANKGKGGIGQAPAVSLEERKKERVALLNEMWELENERKILRTQEDAIAELGKPQKPPKSSIDTKSLLGGKEGSGQKDRYWSSYRTELNAAMQLLKGEYQKQLSLLENQHKLGLVGDAEYYAKRAKLRANDLALEEQAILAAKKLEEDDYQEQLARASKKGPKTVKAVKEQHDAHQTEFKAKLTAVQNKREIEADDDLTEAIKRNREEEVLALKDSNEQKMVITNSFYSKNMESIENERVANERNYRDGLVSATGYYKNIEKFIKAESALNKEKYEAEYKAEKAIIELRMTRYKDHNDLEYKALLSQLEEIQRKHDQWVIDEDIATKNKLRENNNNFLDDIEAVWEGENGFNAVVKKALSDSLVEWQKWGKSVYDATKEMLGAMQDSLSSFFEDYLNGELKSAEDYFKAFGRSINKIFADMMAQKTMEILFGSTGGLFGNLFGTATPTPVAGSGIAPQESQAPGMLESIGGLVGGLFGETGAAIGSDIGKGISTFLFGGSKSIGAKDIQTGQATVQNMMVQSMVVSNSGANSGPMSYSLSGGNSLVGNLVGMFAGGSWGGALSGKDYSTSPGYFETADLCGTSELPLWHTGGIPSLENPQSFRKFHSGIGPGEVPAIIKQDEGVFTKGQMAAMAPINKIGNIVANLVHGQTGRGHNFNTNVPVTINGAENTSNRMSSALRSEIERVVIKTLQRTI